MILVLVVVGISWESAKVCKGIQLSIRMLKNRRVEVGWKPEGVALW